MEWFQDEGSCYRIYEHKRQLCKRSPNKAPNFIYKCTHPRRPNIPVNISQALELSFLYKKSLRGQNCTWPCLLHGALVPLCARQPQTRFISSHLTSVAVFAAQISACVSEIWNSIRLHDIGCFFRNTRLARILTRYGQRPNSSLKLGIRLCSGTIPCVQMLVLEARVWQSLYANAADIVSSHGAYQHDDACARSQGQAASGKKGARKLLELV